MCMQNENQLNVSGKSLLWTKLWFHLKTPVCPVSVPSEGKHKVCEEGVLPILVKLLSDCDPGVTASAAGTIMNTAIITEGKEGNGCERKDILDIYCDYCLK